MARTHNAAGEHGSNHRTSLPLAGQPNWSRLPRDLLGEVYNRLTAPLGRARFAAACTSWRAAASRHAPLRSDHPWLMLDPCVAYKKRRFLYSPEDDVVLPRLSLRRDPARGRFVGCHDGGWVAWSEPPFGILNIFSGAEIALSPKQKRGARGWNDTPLLLRKVIFSDTPTSHGCLIVAITESNRVATCTVGCPEVGWTLHGQCAALDIAFCNGHLYVLMYYSEYDRHLNLTKFEIGVDEHGIPYINTTVDCMASMPSTLSFPNLYDDIYIVELCGKIVMAVRRTLRRCPFSHNIGGPSFSLFTLNDVESDGVSTHRSYKWEEVTRLDDHALFLGPTHSKAVHVPENGRSYAQRNRIYYSHHQCFIVQNYEIPDGAKEFLTSSNNNGHRGSRVYYKEDENIDNDMEGMISVGHYVWGGLHPPMWIFPPEL